MTYRTLTTPRRAARWLALCLLSAAVLLGGCKSAQQKAAEAKARSEVRDVLLRMHETIVGDDIEEYLTLFHGAPMEKEFLGELFELWQVSFRFQDAYIHRFGRDAWRELQKERPTRVSIPARNVRFWESVRIRLKPDGRARCETATEIHMFWMDRFGDEWRIRAGDILNQRASNITPDLIRDHILVTRATAEMIRRFTRRLQEPGVSREKFVADWEAARKEAVVRRRELGAPRDPNQPATQPREETAS
ncbi:MAG: hypothetical protein ACLFV7_07130 [Phycisphaerae bacterium]